jgi:hypothetical protein
MNERKRTVGFDKTGAIIVVGDIVVVDQQLHEPSYRGKIVKIDTEKRRVFVSDMHPALNASFWENWENIYLEGID